jgi:hypothetical protein
MPNQLYISDPNEKERKSLAGNLPYAAGKPDSPAGAVKSPAPGAPGGKRNGMSGDNAPLPPAACPIAALADELTKSLEQSRRGLRRLRRSSHQCRLCPHASACPSMAAFTSAIDAAISELWEEWRGQ